MSETAGEAGELELELEGELEGEDKAEDAGTMSCRCGASEMDKGGAETGRPPVGGGERSAKSASSSLTSNGNGLAAKRDRRADADDEEEELAPALSRSENTNSSCVESHSAVNVYAVSRELPGGDGPTTGELGRLRCTPVRSATLLRIFFTFGCGTETPWKRAQRAVSYQAGDRGDQPCRRERTHLALRCGRGDLHGLADRARGA